MYALCETCTGPSEPRRQAANKLVDEALFAGGVDEMKCEILSKKETKGGNRRDLPVSFAPAPARSQCRTCFCR
jgi:hypothetical protein